MYFPKLPYIIKKRRKEPTVFLGLNRTENYKEGQLRDSIGLTTENYPTLTQSKPFISYSDESGISDMYEHNGRLLLVYANGNLVFDGKAVGIISPGKKQFATVNTRLCIFPDKVYIDLNTIQLHPLAEGLTSADAPDAVEMRDDYISFAADAPTQEGLSETFGDYYEQTNGADRLCTYSYGTDRNAIGKCWDDINKLWVNLRELQEKSALLGWDTMGESGISGLYKGAVFIPEITDTGELRIVYGDHNSPTFSIDISKYNTQGIYCVVTDIETVYEYEEGGTSGPDNPEDTIRYVTSTITYNAYSATDGAVIFSGTFKDGDTVDVTGTPFSLNDGIGVTIAKVWSEANSLAFAQGTFTGALSYLQLDEDLSGEKIIRARYYTKEGDNPDEWETIERSAYYSVNIYDTVKAGKWLYFKNDNPAFIYVWDKTKLTTIGKYEATMVDEQTADMEMLPYSLDGARVRVSRHIPDLDYICESENRLWGVSNKTHTIYASALGLPGEFTDFDVVSTDSYAVAVASEDDFTAICAYGGGVCCFKENRLHKILGSYPAEYYMNEYEITGVQKGSERSLQVINEVLYYKGTNGIYAYSGGTPSLISYELGNTTFAASASATDGMNYYVSLGDGIYVYDKLHSLWIRQTEQTASAMANVNGAVVLLRDGALYGNTGRVSDARWYAELAAFESGISGKRSYGRIIIRIDMSEEAVLQIYVREDNKRIKRVYSHRSPKETSIEVPLPIGRCDRFSIILEGRGKTVLRSMAVEYV